MWVSGRYWGLGLTFLALGVYGAPRSRSKITSYDQKQTGDYNIHVHLKDFQIVALLGDDTLDSLSDYEYNYDYSDLTVKPPHNSTQKPFSTSAASSESINSVKPSKKPSKPQQSSTQKPPTSTSSITTTNSVTEKNPVSSTIPGRINATVAKEELTPKTTSVKPIPGRIAVEIITENVIAIHKYEENGEAKQGINIDDERTPENEKVVRKTDSSEPEKSSSGINESNASLPSLGEISHQRKCPIGAARDKRGRCRKIRRPSASALPFGLTRFATNLASKFRQVTFSEDDTQPHEK